MIPQIKENVLVLAKLIIAISKILKRSHSFISILFSLSLHRYAKSKKVGKYPISLVVSVFYEEMKTLMHKIFAMG